MATFHRPFAVLGLAIDQYREIGVVRRADDTFSHFA